MADCCLLAHHLRLESHRQCQPADTSSAHALLQAATRTEHVSNLQRLASDMQVPTTVSSR
jgi:hypothetical protein